MSKLFPVASSAIGKRIQLFPCLEALNTEYFVTGASRQAECDGITYETAPFALDKNVDMMAISQMPDLIRRGVIDVADTIHPDISVTYIYLKVGDQIVKYDVRSLQASKGKPDLLGDTRGVRIEFNTSDICLNKDSRDIENEFLKETNILSRFNTTINMSVSVGIQISTSRGNGVITRGSVYIDEVESELEDPIVDKAYILPLLRSAYEDKIQFIGFDLDYAIEPRKA